MTASASALSIGSWPQISRYAGKCVVRKTRFSPQTKYAPDITRKPRWRSAWASVSRIVVFASATITGSLSEAPAQNAAGSIAAARAAPGSNRLRLQTSLGNALMWVKGYHAPEASAAFARARELAGGVGDASERFSAYYGLWVGHCNRCEPAPTREMAELFLREATARPDCPEAVVAHRVSGATCWYFGDFAAAHDHFGQTVELY